MIEQRLMFYVYCDKCFMGFHTTCEVEAGKQELLSGLGDNWKVDVETEKLTCPFCNASKIIIDKKIKK